MDNNTIKLTESELTALREVQKNFSDITMGYGQLHLAKISLAEQEKQLDTAFSETKKKENDFVKGLVDQYGQGTLNLQDGSFTPQTPVVEAGNLEVL